MSAKEFSQTEIKDAVKSRYAKAIQGSSSCCGPSATQKGTAVKLLLRADCRRAEGQSRKDRRIRQGRLESAAG